MLRSVTLLLLLLPAAVVVAGCSNDECTLIGCADSLEVRFTGTTTRPARYQIEVVADGVPSSCQLTIPHECSMGPTCSAGPSNWRLILNGCEKGQPVQPSVDGVLFYQNAPTSFDLVVRRDDVVVGGGSFQPVYTESRPNGPECGPVCRNAPDIQTEIAP